MLAQKQNYEAQTFASPGVSTNERVGLKNQRTVEHSLFNRISMLSCIVICACVAWFVATMGARISSANYEIYRLQTQIQKATATNADLNARVDRLSQPSRILEVAKNRLHMFYQNPVQIASGTKSAGQ